MHEGALINQASKLPGEWRSAPANRGEAQFPLFTAKPFATITPMDESIRKQLTPGATVTVTQQIPHRDRTWISAVRGVIVSYEQKQTGSWYAHARDDKLWLDRLQLRRPDGELLTLILDEYSHIEFQSPATAAPVAGPVTPAA
jgi:hypothetical protein